MNYMKLLKIKKNNMKFNYWSGYRSVEFSIGLGKVYCPWGGIEFYLSFFFWHFQLLVKTSKKQKAKRL